MLAPAGRFTKADDLRIGKVTLLFSVVRVYYYNTDFT